MGQHDFEVTGLTRVHERKANAVGDVVIAFFDCRVGAVKLRGCSLVRRKRGNHITIWEPRLSDTPATRGANIIDHELKGAIKEAAAACFVALGGELVPAAA